MRGTATPLTRGPFSITLPDTAGPQTIPSDGSGSSLSDNLMPWVENIDVFMTAISHVNWDTVFVDTAVAYNGTKRNGGAINDEINFDVSLAKGTWIVTILSATTNSFGIVSVQFDEVEKGTIDLYTSSLVPNVRSSVTGIAVPTTGKVRLKLKVTGKNASSSNYYAYLQHIQLKRTA